MSWTMWHVEGTGFDVETAKPDKLQEFLMNHEESLSNWPYANALFDYLNDGPLEADRKLDEIDYESIREISDRYSIADPVSHVMWQETGIRFDCPGLTDNDEDYVLFCRSNPWEYNEIERSLTYKELFYLMKSYADDLGVEMHADVDLVYAG